MNYTILIIGRYCTHSILVSILGIVWAKELNFEPGSIILLVPELAHELDLILIQDGRHQNVDFPILLRVDVTPALPFCVKILKPSPFFVKLADPKGPLFVPKSLRLKWLILRHSCFRLTSPKTLFLDSGPLSPPFCLQHDLIFVKCRYHWVLFW